MFMIKAVGLFKKRKDLTREQFKEYWLTKHIELERKNTGKYFVKRIVASFVVGDNPDEDTPFDGMVELYFSSMEDFKAHISGPMPEIMQEDEKNFCDPDYRVFVATEEYIMVEETPRRTGI